MNHMWVIGAFFKKWVIVHYSRMESKFQNLKPYNIYFNYADFKFLDQNLRSWPSFEKLSPTFFGTSNFETWLSRDPITWQPEVRCFGYKMTHSIILQPQKIFSRTLQILGFIAESYQCTLDACKVMSSFGKFSSFLECNQSYDNQHRYHHSIHRAYWKILFNQFG